MKKRLACCVAIAAKVMVSHPCLADDERAATTPVVAAGVAVPAAVPPAVPPVTRPAPGAPVPPRVLPIVTSGTVAPSPQPVRVLRATPSAAGGPGDPASVAAGPGGFGITSADQKSSIRFALVQGDGRFWFDDTQRPQIGTFLIRRAQPNMEARLPYGINFFLSPDFGGGTVVLQDAYLGVDAFDWLKFRFGKFKPPVGLERLTPTSNLMFVEFGLPTLLVPNRDVGAMVYGDVLDRLLGYAGGIFNGVPDVALPTSRRAATR